MQDDQSTQNPRGIDPVVTIVPESGATDLARSCSLGAILGKVGADPPEDEETKLTEANLFRNLADILAELARHPFPQVGSLGLSGAPGNGAVEVLAQAGDRFGTLDPDGPFETSIDYYTAWAERMSNSRCSCTLEAVSGVESVPETATLLPNDPQYPD